MQLPRIRFTRTPVVQERDTTFTLQGWADYVTQFLVGGNPYTVAGTQGTLGGTEERPDASFHGYVSAMYKANGVVFACMLARLLLFSEARFQFRQFRSGRPGNLFGDRELAILERPWPNGTTGDLLMRMIQDADMAGNAYVARVSANRLFRLRPDWVTILAGSMERPDAELGDPDVEVLGYLYQPGGQASGRKPIPYLREQVAHFAPVPDPEAQYRGMSWLTPVINEVMADKAATSHKLKFFENGATPNMVVKLDLTDAGKFNEWVDLFDAKYGGVHNAYRTLWLAGGADAKVVGADMKQIDFKVTQGAGETRVAAAAGVPPIIVGLSEGLESATYSNYGQARRRFADGTMRPLWRNAAGCLSTLIRVPEASELWYDDRDIPFLQEDQRDAAEVMQFHAQTLKALTEAGYTPDSAKEAVVAGDFARLEHSGLVSVQLLPPGAAANGNGNGPALAQVGQGD